MADLLPCPFCGNRVQISDLEDEDDRRFWFREISCEICDISMREGLGWTRLFDRKDYADRIAVSLVYRWNKRTIASPTAYAVLDMSGESFHSIHETHEEAEQAARFLGSVVQVSLAALQTPHKAKTP